MEEEEDRKQPVGAERDLLHPLATLHWEHCHTWEEGRVWFDSCAVLHDTVVVLDMEGILRISTDLHSWTTTNAPYRYSSLTTYQSKFVLVGGVSPSTGKATDQLWTSSKGLTWEVSLPAMPTNRYWTSSVSGGSPEILVVAGGWDSFNNNLDVVEVLRGDQWTIAASLPTPCSHMRSTFHNGNFYFIRGPYKRNILYMCSCDFLTARTTTRLVWEKMPPTYGTRDIASYSSRLIRIDDYSTITSYSTTIQTWVEPTNVGDVPYNHTDTTLLAVLSTGQLIIVDKVGVYRGNLSVSTFDPDTKFISNVLSRLEAMMGFEIESELATKVDSFTGTSGVILQTRRNMWDVEMTLPDSQKDPVRYVHEMILQWSMGHSPRPPTWRELLQVIQDMGFLELRQQIEAFMKGFYETNARYTGTGEISTRL